MYKNLFMRIANLKEGACVSVAGRTVQYKNNEYRLYNRNTFVNTTTYITVADNFIRGKV